MKPNALKTISAGIILLFAGVNGASAACSVDRIDVRGDWGSTNFSIEIADTSRKQAKGLMFRRHLERDAGMLFVYKTPRHAVFWMKNTLISLDMIFIDEQGRIKTLAANARPLDESQIDGGQGVKLILEVNGGLIAETGIAVGDQIRHPMINQTTAIWPCDP